jgi:hypothetical protein
MVTSVPSRRNISPFSRHSSSFFLCEMSRMMSSFNSGGADSVSMSE